MKIAFIAPFSLFCNEYDIAEYKPLEELIREKMKISKRYSPCDALLQIAADTPSGHELIYMDDQFGSIDTSAEVDIAAISVMTVNADRAYAIAAKFRKRGVHVAMGGIHATLCPEDAEKHCDTLFTGDADKTWKTFLDDFSKKRAKKIYHGGVVDIRKTPPPKIDLLPPKHYFHEALGREYYSLRTSVGCTRGCKFCSNWRKPGCSKVRKKALKQIYNELQLIKKQSKNFSIVLIDDNPFIDLPYIAKVLKIIKEMKIKWVSGADISITNHPKLLKLIKESGNNMLCFGLESIDVRNLKWLAPWKARYAETYKDRIKLLRDFGINAMGSFLFGLEHDTSDTLKRTVDFILEAGLTGVAMGIVTPYPGTNVREKLIKEGRLDMSRPWSDYTGFKLVFEHSTIKKEEMYKGLAWFYEQMYSPSIAGHLSRMAFK